ncbi:STAS domain-containing protein [Desertimonas flava]|uniref:STAS domain-containing protein n=1 Tax=Desertimonas flava TaxID=2064846 RepID=UPI000E341E63|nr:STAS domain-containing protein [Desertimonas flava]
MHQDWGRPVVDWTARLNDCLELRCVRFAHNAPGTLLLTGELDTSAESLLESLLLTLARCRPVLCLDLSEVTFVDMGGLRALRRVAAALRHRGGRLVIEHPSDAVCQLTRLVGALEHRHDPAMAAGAHSVERIVATA